MPIELSESLEYLGPHKCKVCRNDDLLCSYKMVISIVQSLKILSMFLFYVPAKDIKNRTLLYASTHRTNYA